MYITKEQRIKLGVKVNNEFANMNGERKNYLTGYIGKDDMSLDFGPKKVNSFIREDKVGTRFTFTITNKTGIDQKVALCPAYFDTSKLVITQDVGQVITGAEIKPISVAALNAAGFAEITVMLADGVMKTEGAGDITATASNKSIAEFLNSAKYSPVRVVGFDLTANDSQVYPQSISENVVSPYRQTGTIEIDVAGALTSSNNLGTKIEIEEAMQFDSSTVMWVDVAGLDSQSNPNVVLKFSYRIGATKNIGRELRNKAFLAYNNISEIILGMES